MIMWLIIAIVIFMLIKFAADHNKQVKDVAQQGGMRVKYRTLINHLLTDDSNCRILQEKTTFILLGVSHPGNSSVFMIQQTFGTVTIEYQIKSIVFGNHKLEWTFNEYADQNKMVEKITHDIERLNNDIMQNFV